MIIIIITIIIIFCQSEFGHVPNEAPVCTLLWKIMCMDIILLFSLALLMLLLVIGGVY